MIPASGLLARGSRSLASLGSMLATLLEMSELLFVLVATASCCRYSGCCSSRRLGQWAVTWLLLAFLQGPLEAHVGKKADKALTPADAASRKLPASAYFACQALPIFRALLRRGLC